MESKFTMSSEQFEEANGRARFTVIGVGGGGGNAVQHMVQSGIKNITCVCANTDKQVLDKIDSPNKLQLGIKITRGLGAGGDPNVGREAAEDDEEQIRQLLENSDMVFITAGMGGGTGTGAAPVVARLAKDMGVLTVAVVTMPFSFEGGKRVKVANAGVAELSEFVDSIITIPNDKLMEVYGKIGMKEAFKKADEVLLQAVQGISNMVSEEGFINIDFNDIKTAMQSRGHAMMGMGKASGEDRAEQAAEKAIKSPLLDNLLLKNAKGLLVNVVSNSDFSLEEYQRITQKVASLVDIDEANIFYGVVFDDSIGDEMHVTVVATGLTLDDSPKPRTPVFNTTHHAQKVDTSTHQPAIRQDIPPIVPPPIPPQPPVQPAPKPNTPPQNAGTSIQEYLRRQQGK